MILNLSHSNRVTLQNKSMHLIQKSRLLIWTKVWNNQQFLRSPVRQARNQSFPCFFSSRISDRARIYNTFLSIHACTLNWLRIWADSVSQWCSWTNFAGRISALTQRQGSWTSLNKEWQGRIVTGIWQRSWVALEFTTMPPCTAVFFSFLKSSPRFSKIFNISLKGCSKKRAISKIS